MCLHGPFGDIQGERDVVTLLLEAEIQPAGAGKKAYDSRLRDLHA
jgi:hypothetical protein